MQRDDPAPVPPVRPGDVDHLHPPERTGPHPHEGMLQAAEPAGRVEKRGDARVGDGREGAQILPVDGLLRHAHGQPAETTAGLRDQLVEADQAVRLALPGVAEDRDLVAFVVDRAAAERSDSRHVHEVRQGHGRQHGHVVVEDGVLALRVERQVHDLAPGLPVLVRDPGGVVVDVAYVEAGVDVGGRRRGSSP